MANPWDRQPGETKQAYAAFLAYRNMGPTRTLIGAYRGHETGTKQARQMPGSWKAWLKSWRWHDRAAAWDLDLARHADRAVVQEVVSEARTWTRRQGIYREALWKPFQLAVAAFDKAEREATELGRDVAIEVIQKFFEILKLMKAEAKEAILGFPGSEADSPATPRLNIPGSDDRHPNADPEHAGGRPAPAGPGVGEPPEAAPD